MSAVGEDGVATSVNAGRLALVGVIGAVVDGVVGAGTKGDGWMLLGVEVSKLPLDSVLGSSQSSI